MEKARECPLFMKGDVRADCLLLAVPMAVPLEAGGGPCPPPPTPSGSLFSSPLTCLTPLPNGYLSVLLRCAQRGPISCHQSREVAFVGQHRGLGGGRRGHVVPFLWD